MARGAVVTGMEVATAIAIGIVVARIAEDPIAMIVTEIEVVAGPIGTITTAIVDVIPVKVGLVPVHARRGMTVTETVVAILVRVIETEIGEGEVDGILHVTVVIVTETEIGTVEEIEKMVEVVEGIGKETGIEVIEMVVDETNEIRTDGKTQCQSS